MAEELQLVRKPDDRRTYVLDGVGTLHWTGWGSRAATAEADGLHWHIERRGVLHPIIEVTDPMARVVGDFAGRTLKHGGTLRWSEQEFTLQPDSRWRERYRLSDGDRPLALIEGKGWGKRPVSVMIDDTADIDPGLLLFAAFVVRALADSQSASASTTTSAGA
jgi:hypothetical protein